MEKKWPMRQVHSLLLTNHDQGSLKHNGHRHRHSNYLPLLLLAYKKRDEGK